MFIVNKGKNGIVIGCIQIAFCIYDVLFSLLFIASLNLVFFCLIISCKRVFWWPWRARVKSGLADRCTGNLRTTLADQLRILRVGLREQYAITLSCERCVPLMLLRLQYKVATSNLA